ncbi:MAG: Maf family nucleotide pyrophosphatase [Chitinophagaceae bacterium]
MNSIILASQSPRRKQLLEWANIDFEVQVSNTNEIYPSNLALSEVPIYIAKEKAAAVKALNSNCTKPIVAADTIVVFDDEVLGKPTSRENAFEILKKLNGQQHSVITGVVILIEDKEISFSETTLVEFNLLTDEQLWFYIDNYKPYDKAGAYAIQEWIGVVGIKRIEGDFYNVMGLPINKLYTVLQNI